MLKFCIWCPKWSHSQHNHRFPQLFPEHCRTILAGFSYCFLRVNYCLFFLCFVLNFWMRKLGCHVKIIFSKVTDVWKSKLLGVTFDVENVNIQIFLFIVLTYQTRDIWVKDWPHKVLVKNKIKIKMHFDHTVSLIGGFLAETFLLWDTMENIYIIFLLEMMKLNVEISKLLATWLALENIN